MAKWLTSNWLTSNLKIKLVSLFLAVVVWLYASGEERVEVSKIIPVRFEAPSKTMKVLDNSLKSVKVTMLVPRNILSSVSSAELSAYHKIKDVNRAGEYSFLVNRQDFDLPPGNIQITKIEPEVIKVALDEVVSIKLPVEPNFLGEPGIGYAVDKENIMLDPNAAMIEGPKSKIERMTTVFTEPIDLVGRTRSFSKKIQLMLDPDLKSVISPLLIDIYVPIKEEFSDVNVPDLKISVLSSPDQSYKVELDPSVVTVTLKGPLASFEGFDPKTILAYVNIQNLKEGDYSLPLELKLPSRVSLKGDPPLVKVRLEKLKR